MLREAEGLRARFVGVEGGFGEEGGVGDWGNIMNFDSGSGDGYGNAYSNANNGIDRNDRNDAELEQRMMTIMMKNNLLPQHQ